MSSDPAGADRRALLQDALRALDEMQAKLDRVEAEAHEPIAVVGMSCRFPGGANSPEEYWELLRDGRDVVTPYPDERRALAEASGIDVDTFGDTTWPGGFLDQIDQFEPQLFGISPREADSMDPQQRLVLEVSWEALERAGIAPDRLGGSATGVFLGITTNEYVQLAKLGGPDELDVYSATGGALNAASGRVAYTLGLQGPCMAIDTACSSSLVALHQACASLRGRESDMALAGGVNVLLLPEAFICFDRWGMMAPDGRCKTFDAAADGFVRGEGCGMLVLKRQRDALADGDPILAVIRGSAVNQDGASSGLTVPNGPAQQAVLRQAYAAARIAPADVQYFEAHGTGTTLGDPIEVEAMGAVLGRGRGDRPLTIGSVKTNLGHLESAAGIAGVIKVVLAMQHGEIPPHLHLHERSPQIPWPSFPVEIPTSPTPWPAVDGRRVAGVSGFGFSGTNAHVVLASPPPSERTAPTEDATPHVLPLSARNEPALRALAGRLADRLTADPPLSLDDVCLTAASGRARFARRAAIVADSTAQMGERLRSFAEGAEPIAGAVGRAARPDVGFVFTGQGSQYPGMGRRLYETQPAFRDALDRVAATIDDLAGGSLLSVLWAEGTSSAADELSQTGWTQPAVFALEWALAELWRSWGVSPQVVTGHSVGELVAATVAGVMSMEDAARLVVARGRLMQELPAGGAMAAVFAPVEDVSPVVEADEGVVAVAAVNGPAHTVVSGEAPAVERICSALAERGVRVQQLIVSHAFHSPLMEPMLAEFAAVAAGITYHPPTTTLVTNVGGVVADDSIATADHWVRHVMAPVDFAAGASTLAELGVDTLVEIGPHPVLLPMAQESLPGTAMTLIPSLRRKHDDGEQILAALGSYWVAGGRVDWPALLPDRARRIALPTYPFERQRHWIPPVRRSARGGRPSDHPLLGAATRAPSIGTSIFETEVAADWPSWLADHRLSGTIVFPGSGFIELALAAADGAEIESLAIEEPLVLPTDGGVVLQTTAVVAPGGSIAIEVVSPGASSVPPAGGWVRHVRATARSAAGSVDDAAPGLADLLDDHAEEIDVDGYYARLRDVGLTYGPMFRGLRQLRRQDGVALGRATLPQEVIDGDRYHLHPALLDACFHVLGAAIAPPDDTGDDMFVPVLVEGLRVFRSGATDVWCAVTVLAEEDGGRTIAARVELHDDDGTPVALLERLVVRRTPRSMWQRHAAGDPIYELAWRSQPRPEASSDEAGRRWLLFTDGVAFGERLAAQLRAGGSSCTVVVPGDATAETGPERWTQRIDDDDGLDRLLATASGPEVGVVYARALDPISGTDDVDVEVEPILRGALAVARGLAARPAPGVRLWMVTRGAQSVSGEPASPAQATLWGLGRVVANEAPMLSCGVIDLDPAVDDVVDDLVAELRSGSGDVQVALRGRARTVARLARSRPDDQEVVVPHQLVLAERGSLDNVAFQPLQRRPPGAGEIEVEVRATGINFRDVLNVLGMYPGDPGAPGLECAGVVAAVGEGVEGLTVGDEVVGIAPQAFDSHVVTDARLMVRKPAGSSFAESATIPIAFLTAAYGLRQLADLRAGERVLVHAAAGGVGMAAVQIAQRVGAEVFATVGSPEKRRVLEALGVGHVYNSRTLDFAEEIAADTGGAGVDVVLNSLSDEFIDAGFQVLAPAGRFLEIGKRGIWTPEQVAAVRPQAQYHPYDLADFLQADIDDVHRALQEVVDDIEAGLASPLPLRAFAAGHVHDAFRFMAQARHIGKVVLTHPTAAEVVRPDGAYLVTGGLGGLGLAVAGRLVERGARHLVLVGRSEPTSSATEAIGEMEQAGARVRVVQADVSQAPDVARLLEDLDRDTPLRGVFHVAGVVDDGALGQQTWSRFEGVLAPKVTGAALLHRATRSLDLDHFVLFSSASALFGAPGQSSYSAANNALDALAHHRRAVGLPALSIDWGPWAEVGMAARLDERERSQLTGLGFQALDPAQALDALERLLAERATQAAVLDVDWSTVAAQYPPDAVPPMFAEVLLDAVPSDGAEVESGERLADVLAEAEPDERRALIDAYVEAQVVRVLRLDPSQQIDPAEGLTEIGMDSLMAVELSNRVRADVDVPVPSTLAFEYPTLDALREYLAGELLGVAAVPVGGAAARPAPAADVEPLEEISDDDVVDKLLEELEESGY